jgi:hypothetical protein
MTLRICVAVLVVVGIACGGGGRGGGSSSGGGGGAGAGAGGGSGPTGVTGDAIVPNNATPPIGLTWHVGLNQNVPLATLQDWFAKMQQLSADLWSASEGQVWIAHIKIQDAAPDPAVLDAWVDVGSSSGGGQMLWMTGRQGRHIAVDSAATPFVLLHEASHMIFKLSWTIPDPTMWPGDYLVDEYDDGMQDDECIMESVFSPTPPKRWCGPDNHVSQSVQPTSCWSQILADYPNFTWSGTNAAASPPPPATVEYVDAP